MKQLPHGGPTNIRRHGTKIKRRANWRSGFVHPWDKVYLNVLLTFTLPFFVIICISGSRTYEYTSLKPVG